MKTANYSALLFLGLGIALFTSGCGGGSSPTSVSMSPPAVTVAFLGTGNVQPGGTAQFVATVSNDPSGKGVTWSVSCSSAPCGTVSPTSTASGAQTTYTAPNTPQPTDLSITVTGVSVADSNVSNSAAIVVSGVTISVNPASLSVDVGTTAQLSANCGQ